MNEYKKIIEKIIEAKAIKSLHNKSKFMYTLYLLWIIRFKDYTLHHDMYNYGVTARFVPNVYNPFMYVVLAIYFIIVTVYHTTINMRYELNKINNGVITYFE